MWKALVLTGLSVVLYSLPAVATQYDVLYVKPGGDDSKNCGSVANACATIGQAVDNARVYDATTIKVAQGQYAEHIYITETLPEDVSKQLVIEGGWSADFTSQSLNPQLTRLSPSGDTPVLSINLGALASADVRLRYLSLAGTADAHRFGIDISAVQSAADLTVEHCILDSFHGNAIHLYANTGADLIVMVNHSTIQGTVQKPVDNPWPGGAVSANSWAGSTIEVTMTGNRILGNQASSGGGVYLFASDATLNATLSNNLLAENSASPQQGGAFFAVTGGSAEMELFLTNNTLSANDAISRAKGFSAATFGTSTLSAWLKNNIIWNDGIDISTEEYETSTLNVKAEYSVIGSVNTDDGGTFEDSPNNLDNDPLLSNNYHLSPTSPAKDKGICGLKLLIYTRIAPYDDIDGDPRPGWGIITGCDIGADEYRFPWILFNPAFTKPQ